MSKAWLHIAVDVLPYGVPFPEGARVLKAEVSEQGRVIGILVEHADIPPEADWVSAQFIKAHDGPTQFDKWVVIPNTGLAASADTRPKGGDGTKIAAPFTSGAVLAEQTPNPSPSPAAGR